MGYTLKLDIYYLSLTKITSEFKRFVRGQEITVYKTDKDDCLIGDFVNSLSSDGSEMNHMEVFMKDFYGKFNDSFIRNKSNTQAVSIAKDNPINNYNSKNNTVWGIFKGGSTGVELEVYEADNAIDVKSRIKDNNVTSIHYFFKIWLPYDSNVGVLMIQSYTNTGQSGLFKDQFDNYFIKRGYKARWSKHIPEEYIKKYLKDGYLFEVQVIHRKRDKKEAFEPIFGPIMKAKSKSVISGFKILFSDFISVKGYQDILKSHIKSLDTEFDELSDTVKLFYVDSEGRKANTTLANVESILPTMILDDALKDENQLPKWNELHKHTDELLEYIKSNITYTPKVR